MNMTQEELVRHLRTMFPEKTSGEQASGVEKNDGKTEEPSSVGKTESAKKDHVGDCALPASELLARLTKVEKKRRVSVSKEAEAVANGLTAFMSEWGVKDSARMTSSFCAAARNGQAAEYLTGRFALSQQLNDFACEVENKCKSKEFEQLAETAKSVVAKKTVNTRLALFYGDPGSGKSTFVKRQFPTADHYFCTEDRRAIDLVSEVALDFETGKKGFVPSTIAKAMEEGKPVILDEINLLDPSVLASVQAMTDDTDSITVAGNRFVIRPGFCIVGTLNLETGMGLRPLPEALVDRAMVIRKFDQPSAKERAAWAGLE